MATSTQKGRKLKHGWHPSLPDHRAKKYSVPRHVTAVRLPASVDLRTTGFLPPVYDQMQLGSCFPAGTPILMADGTERPIEEVALGNEIRAHDGCARKVSRVYERPYSDMLYTIKVQGWDYPLTMTDEHPVGVVENVHRRAKFGAFEAGRLNWIAAKDLKPGDFVLMPGQHKSEDTGDPTINIVDYIADKAHVVDGKIRLLDARKTHSIPASIAVTETFCRLVGLFLAEGSYGKFGGRPVEINFTFARHEREYQTFVVDALREVFGAEAHTVESDKRESVSDVVCSNATLARFFFNLCGEYALGKFVNPIFFACAERHRLALIRGWLQGDGTQNPVRTTRQDGETRRAAQIEGTTSSIRLHRDFFQLAMRCGMKPGTQIRKQRDYQNADSRSLLLYSNDVTKVFPEARAAIEDAGISTSGRTWYKKHDLGFLCRIKSIETELPEEEIKVFNLEVEGSHTYIANFIAVHNCTGNAIAGAVEFDRSKQGLPDWMPSRLFIYYNERSIENTVASDCGAQISDGIKVINTIGVCQETTWPYSDQGTVFATKPSDAAFTEAAQHESVSYEQVTQDAANIKGCLAEGYPVVFGFTVYDGFESDAVAQSGVLALPQPTEQCQGGHAVLMVGYDDTKQMFLVRNSWGADWGQGGYFWAPYAYFLSTDLADDFWTIRVMAQ